MRIYKNNASINMSLDEFLEFLEEEALDDLLHMLEQIDENGSIHGDFDGDFIHLSGEDFEATLDDIFANMDDDDFIYMSEIDEEMFNALMGADAELLDELLMSNEDIKVRKIVEAFSFIDDSKS